MFRSFVVSGPSSTMPSLLRKGIPLNSRVLERIRCLHSVLEEQQLVNETTSKKMTRLLTGVGREQAKLTKFVSLSSTGRVLQAQTEQFDDFASALRGELRAEIKTQLESLTSMMSLASSWSRRG